VERRQRDALGDRGVLLGGPPVEVVDERVERPPASANSTAWSISACQDSQRSRVWPRDSGGDSVQPIPARVPRTVSSRSPPSLERAAPRIRVTASRTSGRSKNRKPPRTT